MRGEQLLELWTVRTEGDARLGKNAVLNQTERGGELNTQLRSLSIRTLYSVTSDKPTQKVRQESAEMLMPSTHSEFQFRITITHSMSMGGGSKAAFPVTHSYDVLFHTQYAHTQHTDFAKPRPLDYDTILLFDSISLADEFGV
jgi:hypothetical protein